MSVGRKLLPHTFGPWFTRFDSLTEVQKKAIPAVVTGRDVLISSATASGKTEAYAAPCAERILAETKREPGCRCLIVSPTRALANDLKRRLTGPMERVGLALGRYTGEHKERRSGHLPEVTISTLEALDSLLARRPHVLGDLQSIVLDEIHVVDNTSRGDQLRLLLERLDHVAENPQRIAVSATVEAPEEMAERYLDEAEIVVVPGARRILGKFFEGRRQDEMARHLDELAQAGFKKILVFCQSRNQVELFATKLPGRTRFQERLFAHHGSLAKSQRERTERLFHGAPAAVCFATLTLEMGIDIGTVDYVLLVGAPSDVSSLLQRIGRGGRRGDTTRAGFAIEDSAERHVVRTMVQLGKQGQLCSPPYGFRTSVLIQQALVLACAHGWVSEEELTAALPGRVRKEIGPDAARQVLRALEAAEHLERSGGRLVPSESIEARYHRGLLHSNISDTPTMDVVDRLTGDVIGHVTHADSNKLRLGGGEREIVAASGKRILTDRGRDGKRPYFRSAGAPLVSFAQARAVVRNLEELGLEVAEDSFVLVPSPAGWVWVHGLGTVGALYSAALCSRRGVRILGSSPYFTWIDPSGADFEGETFDPRQVLRPEPGELQLFCADQIERLLPLTEPGPWDSTLPSKLRQDVALRCLDLSGIDGFLTRARWRKHKHELPDLEVFWKRL